MNAGTLEPETSRQFVAFQGARKVGDGDICTVAVQARNAMDDPAQCTVIIFDSVTSQRVDIDFRGTVDEMLARIPECVGDLPKGPGRPKLGVVPREVTLLPSHWEWLNSQPGGASVALRKLVTEARRANEAKDRSRLAKEATYRFITVMAGDLADFEEASRALFAEDWPRFAELTQVWPDDVREHSGRLAKLAQQTAG